MRFEKVRGRVGAAGGVSDCNAKREVLCCTGTDITSCWTQSCVGVDDMADCQDACATAMGGAANDLSAFYNAAVDAVEFDGVDAIREPTVHEVLFYYGTAEGFKPPRRLSQSQSKWWPGNTLNGGVAVSDVNNDGRPDLVFPIYNAGMQEGAYESYMYGGNGGLPARFKHPLQSKDQVLLNPGGRSDEWVEGVVPADRGKSYGIAVGDIDGNASVEIIKVGENRFSVWSHPPVSTEP